MNRSSAPLVPAARDSAGIRILEHAPDALERAPIIRIDSVPIAVIGAGDADLDLSRVYSCVVLRDGGIAFFAHNVVHVLSADGTRHDRIGRRGAGPGEFQDGELAWGLGDTLLVTDEGNSRISWIVPGRGVVRTRMVPLSRPGRGYGAIAQWTGDTLIMATITYFPQFAEGKRVQMPVGVLAAANDSIRVLVPLEGSEMRVMPFAPDDGWGNTAAVRYTPVPQAGAWGDGVLAVRPERWKLDRFRPAGGLRSSVRVPITPIPITQELRERDIRGNIAMAAARPGAAPETSSVYNRYRHFPYATSLPAFSTVTTTPGGIAWVKDQRLAADTTWAYTAVAADGRILGRLLGHGGAPVAFGDDRVVMRHEDIDGVVTWRVLRVTF